jgi:hypothetical protein
VRDLQIRRTCTPMSALLASIATLAMFGCNQKHDSRGQVQVADWHRMRVEAGSEFTLTDNDTGLSLRQLSSKERQTFSSIHFKWINARDSGNFAEARRSCLTGTKYKCQQLDSTRIPSAERYSVENGSLADSDYTAAGNCALKNRTIEARYACWNDSCRRTKLIMTKAFASLGVERR